MKARTRSAINNGQDSFSLLQYAESLDNEAAFAHNYEGYLWIRKGNLQRAEQAFAKAIEIDRTSGQAFNNLAVSYFSSGKTQEAFLLQQTAIQSDPNSIIALYNMGIILMNRNDFQGAIRSFREASFMDPTWTLPYVQQGYLYLQIRDYKNAEETARDAIKSDASQQSAFLILGIALYNQNEIQEAYQSIHKALQLNPEDRIAKFYKALIFKEQGKDDFALIVLQQLLEHPNSDNEVMRIHAEMEAIQRSLQNLSAGFR